jgi:hypothetical protein
MVRIKNMAKKWGNKQWYEYHKAKAVDAAIQTYAGPEKAVLDTIDKKFPSCKIKLSGFHPRLLVGQGFFL